LKLICQFQFQLVVATFSIIGQIIDEKQARLWLSMTHTTNNKQQQAVALVVFWSLLAS
jgi:hypothetical protein